MCSSDLGQVVNAGAWITDPTTNTFENTLTVTSSGYIQMSAGDVYVFSNDFINVSTQSNLFDTTAGKFLFGNDTGSTQTFTVAGIDFPSIAGPGVPNATNIVDLTSLVGLSTNFALGTLEISNFSTVRVTDAFSLLGPGPDDNKMAGLYLENLILGQNSLLIIGTNVQVYVKKSNDWSLANILLENNPTYDNSINGIHYLFVIPEPGVLTMYAAGLLTLLAARRRQRGQSPSATPPTKPTKPLRSKIGRAHV